MTSESVTAWATAITAVGALLLIAVTLWVEYSRRRYDRSQAHLHQLREYVLTPLGQQLVDHYLPILGRRDVLLQIQTDEGKVSYDAVSGRVIEWRPRLMMKGGLPSWGATIGDRQRLLDYDATFPHLYEDARDYHFQEVFKRWESLGEQVRALSEECLRQCALWQARLAERLHFHEANGKDIPLPRADYLRLSLYLLEQICERYPNTVSLIHSSQHWMLQISGNCLAEGSNEEMTLCRDVLAELVLTEEESMKKALSQMEALHQTATSIKEEIERILLQQHSLASCPYVQVSLL
jgi:hypothetical protein